MTIKTELLKSTVKENHIANLKTGDLVKLKADVMPIIYHYGFIVRSGDEILFYHNQQSLSNVFGGNLVVEDFKKYSKGREIVSIKNTDLTQDDISKMADVLKDKKYHIVNNNCEHMVSKILDTDLTSPQVNKWLFGALAVTAVYLILKK